MLAERQQPARVPPASLLHACKKRASLFRFLHEILARDSCTPLAQFSEVLHASCTPTGHLHACKLRARGLNHTSSLIYLRYHFPDVKRARACTCWSYSCTLKKHGFSVQEVSLARLFARFSFAVRGWCGGGGTATKSSKMRIELRVHVHVIPPTK